MAKNTGWKLYDDLAWIIKVILAIFFVGYFVHLIYRILTGHLIAAILWFIVPLSWIFDLVCVVLKGRPCVWPGQ